MKNWWTVYQEEAGDDNGGGGGGDDDNGKTFTEDEVKSLLEKEVGGLKSKVAELLGNNTKLSDQLKEYGDITPDRVKDIISKMDNDEDQDMIKSGKFDELLEKKVGKAKEPLEQRIAELEKENADLKEHSDDGWTRYKGKFVTDGARQAAIEAGVRKEAVDDVVDAAAKVFSVGDDNELEARDGDGELIRTEDGKILTMANWLEGLKGTKPHYWPDSKGANALGNTGDARIAGDLTKKIEAAAAAGDMTEYRRLRKAAEKK